MKRRISFGFRERRRDQRRPVTVEGQIDGVRVTLLDLSMTGVGGGVNALGGAADLDLRAGEKRTLQFTGPDGATVSLPVSVRRVDGPARGFGANFAALSEREFDAIEQLMFPRRAAMKA